jgi:hypothetical protein
VELAVGPDLERVRLEVHLRDVLRDELGALALGLAAEPLHEVGARDLLDEARVVLDVGREHQLAAGHEAAGVEPLEHERLQVRAGRVDRRG